MRILSLDIGSDRLKAVELDARFGRVELVNYFAEQVVEPPFLEPKINPVATEEEANPPGKEETTLPPPRVVLTTGQINALKSLLTAQKFQYDRVSVTLPRSLVTTRLMTFPTKDKKSIQKSLLFELEDEIPIGLDDVIYDFAILQTQGTTSTVFTAIALKKDIQAFLIELQMLGIDPDVITTESWALSQLTNDAAPTCIINMGASKSVMHMVVAQNPVITHSANLGGNQVTAAIAKQYGLSFDQAEKSKIDGAFLLTSGHLEGKVQSEPITEEQRIFAQTISVALVPLIKEIKQTLMSFKSQYHMTPKALYLTGGTSLIPNMAPFLEEILQFPVTALQYSNFVAGPTLQLSAITEALFSTSIGLALSLTKGNKATLINFRKDEFEKQGGVGGFSVKAFQKPLKYLAASLAFIYVNLIVQYAVLSARSEKQLLSFERAVKSVLGSSISKSSIATYQNSPSSLKSAVTKETAKYKPTSVSPAQKQISAFEILNKISTAMPRDMILDVSIFSIKDAQLQLKGTVSQLSDTDRIAKVVEDTKLVSAISKGKTEEDPKTKKIKFEISGKIAEGAQK